MASAAFEKWAGMLWAVVVWSPGECCGVAPTPAPELDVDDEP
jgi:hypothetical protein